MNYGNIKKNDIADGPGVRITLFVSGCTHHCEGCFQPETWNFDFGEPFTKETEDYIIELMRPSYVDGLTLLGGEPMEPDNQRALLPFVKRVREIYPEKNIWCYTGYTLERDILEEGRLKVTESLNVSSEAEQSADESVKSGHAARCEVTDEFLSLIDILVDGEFKIAKKNLMLQFRGSENQRVIDLRKTLESGEITIWSELRR